MGYCFPEPYTKLSYTCAKIKKEQRVSLGFTRHAFCMKSQLPSGSAEQTDSYLNDSLKHMSQGQE